MTLRQFDSNSSRRSILPLSQKYLLSWRLLVISSQKCSCERKYRRTYYLPNISISAGLNRSVFLDIDLYSLLKNGCQCDNLQNKYFTKQQHILSNVSPTTDTTKTVINNREKVIKTKTKMGDTIWYGLNHPTANQWK